MSEYINHRGLNIAHINIRSLLSKKDTLSIYLKNSNPVVLCISESWLSKCIPDNVVRFQGYDIIRNDRKTLKVLQSQVVVWQYLFLRIYILNVLLWPTQIIVTKILNLCGLHSNVEI